MDLEYLSLCFHNQSCYVSSKRTKELACIFIIRQFSSTFSLGKCEDYKEDYFFCLCFLYL